MCPCKFSPRAPGGIWPTPFSPWSCGYDILTNKNSSSGSPNESADTPFAPVSATQGLQEAHGLLLLVSGAGVGGGIYQPIKNSSSESPNESADTPFAPVSPTQGLQEAHGLHLLVPGAGVEVQIHRSSINEHGPSCD